MIIMSDDNDDMKNIKLIYKFISIYCMIHEAFRDFSLFVCDFFGWNRGSCFDAIYLLFMSYIIYIIYIIYNSY